MKKVPVVLLLIFIFVQADAKKIQGKIILNNDEAINVTFIIPVGFLRSGPNYEKLQTKVRYIDASNKKVMLGPDDAKEISFDFNGQKIRMQAVHDDLQLQSIFSTQNRIFLKLEIDGALKLFTSYFTKRSPGMYSASTGAMSGGMTYNGERYVLQKNNGSLFQPRGISFRKDMREYLSDCPELVRKIQNKDFRKGDMELIVIDYNKSCAD